MRLQKQKEFTLFNLDNDVPLAIDSRGDIYHAEYQSDSDDKTDYRLTSRVLEAKEVDAIAKMSALRASLDGNMPRETETGEEILFEDNGSIGIGCQSFDAKDIAAVARLSRLLAASKKRKR